MSVECKLNEITKVLDSKYDKSNPKGYISGVNWGKIGGNIRWQVDLLNLINSEINSFGISLNDIAHWNEAYSWGDHALAGYGTSNFNPSDLLTDYGFTDNSADWNTAFSWGNHALAGYLTSFSETDPIFSASASAGIAGTDITNWNTAFGWGNHASAGYALSSALTGYVPYIGATANLNMGVNKILTPRIDGTVATSNIQLGAAINIVADYNTYTLQKMSVGSGDMSAMFGVRGNSAVSGTAFLVQNSTPTTLFTVLNIGNVGIGISNPTARLSVGNDGGYNGALLVSPVGTNTTRLAMIGSFEIVTNGSPSWTGQGFSIAGANRTFEFIASASNVTDDRMFNIRAGSSFSVFSNPTTGTKIFLSVGAAQTGALTTFSPTSGSANYIILNLTSTINQTGGANGITRGIYIAPTLTAAADYRAIEAITGNSSAHTLMKLNNGVQDVFCVKGDGKAGFFGVAPASQQTMGVATAGATYTAAEQAMIQKCWDVLRSFGLGN